MWPDHCFALKGLCFEALGLGCFGQQPVWWAILQCIHGAPATQRNTDLMFCDINRKDFPRAFMDFVLDISSCHYFPIILFFFLIIQSLSYWPETTLSCFLPDPRLPLHSLPLILSAFPIKTLGSHVLSLLGPLLLDKSSWRERCGELEGTLARGRLADSLHLMLLN